MRRPAFHERDREVGSEQGLAAARDHQARGAAFTRVEVVVVEVVEAHRRFASERADRGAREAEVAAAVAGASHRQDAAGEEAAALPLVRLRCDRQSHAPLSTEDQARRRALRSSGR